MLINVQRIYVCLRDLTDPTVRRPPCEANGCLPRNLKSPEVHCCVPSLKTAPFPQPHKPTPHHLFKIHFNIIFTMSKPSPVVSYLRRFLSNITYITPIASMCATRPAHLNLFCLSNVVKLVHGEEWNASISSLRDFLQLPRPFSPLKSNSSPCPQMLAPFMLLPPLNVARQFSHSHSKAIN